jgi:hypothetical protein
MVIIESYIIVATVLSQIILHLRSILHQCDPKSFYCIYVFQQTLQVVVALICP